MLFNSVMMSMSVMPAKSQHYAHIDSEFYVSCINQTTRAMSTSVYLCNNYIKNINAGPS
jgi:hypothetical protein